MFLEATVFDVYVFVCRAATYLVNVDLPMASSCVAEPNGVLLVLLKF